MDEVKVVMDKVTKMLPQCSAITFTAPQASQCIASRRSAQLKIT